MDRSEAKETNTLLTGVTGELFSDKRLARLGYDDIEYAKSITNKGNPYYNLLPLSGSAIKEKKENSFDYIEHYTQDHKNFDYTKNSPCAAQVNDERRVHERILSHIDKPIIANSKVLDVGCGGGWLSQALIPDGAGIVSMDLSPVTVGKVLDLNESANHIGVVADSMNHPFADGLFDFIIASEVIEHVPDPEGFLNSLSTALKPGGSIIITTPYKENIIYETCIHCNHATPRNAHLHSFDEKILTSISPTGLIASYEIFGNKALMKLRTHKLLGWMKAGLYSKVDGLSNKVFNKPAHIIVKYQKI
jgi:2-polyprenyl-3-methyl-5-hydroxy-6-metoxy-1,4-benzoquinol methylase